MEANTLEDIATVVIDANTLEETVLFLESETESDLGVDMTESTLNYFGGFLKIVPKIWI